MDAAMHGHAEVIKLLLDAGATAIKTKEVSRVLATALHNNVRAHRCSVNMCIATI